MQAAMSQMQGGGLGGMGGFGGLGGLGGLGGMGGMGGMGGLGGLGAQGAQGANVDFKTLYAEQLTQLQGMGFTNESTNIEVLKATGGNVEAAVERLLNMLG
jgi:ubiquilin